MPLNLLMAHFWFSCFHVLTLVSFGLATGRWFSLGTPVSSTNKTYRHDITEIFLKVALNTINPNPQMFLDFYTMFFTTIHNPSWTFQLWFQSYAPMGWVGGGGGGGGGGRRESMSYGYILPFYFYKQIEYYT